MPKKQSANPPMTPPQPIVYTIDFGFPITLVAFREKDAVESSWAWIDSTGIRTLWLDTATIAPAGADTFAIWTAFRFTTPQPGRDAAANRLIVEGRIRHLIECRDRRMRSLEWDTRDAVGAVVDAGRLDGEWLRPFEESSYANLIELVCELVGMPRPKRA